MNDRPIKRRAFNSRLALIAAGGYALPAIGANLSATPEQVEGPFHPVNTQSDTDMDLTRIAGNDRVATGEPILVHGRVLDENGEPLENALVDVWQANHFGRYAHHRDPNTAPLDPNFQGWGLLRTDEQGLYRFKTIKPGAYPLEFLGDRGMRCRHIHYKVSHPSRKTLTTQMYFEGDPLIEQDMEIAKAPADKRHLLIASAVKDEDTGLPLYTFDVVLAAG